MGKQPAHVCRNVEFTLQEETITFQKEGLGIVLEGDDGYLEVALQALVEEQPASVPVEQPAQLRCNVDFTSQEESITFQIEAWELSLKGMTGILKRLCKRLLSRDRS